MTSLSRIDFKAKCYMDRYDTVKIISGNSTVLEYKVYNQEKGEWVFRRIVIDKSEQQRSFGCVTFAQHNGYVRSFKNEVERNINKDAELNAMRIKEKLSRTMGIRGRDIEEIEKCLEEDLPFYEFDINLAYFQTCYILGYISEDFYNKHVNLRELKQSMREAVTWLSRSKVKEYYFKGSDKPYRTETIESEDLKAVHTNVRAFLVNIIDGAINVVKNDYLAHTIDSITFKEASFDALRDYFMKSNVKFKIKPCFKIDEQSYKAGNTTVSIKQNTQIYGSNKD
jgi:hypothetical protein